MKRRIILLIATMTMVSSLFTGCGKTNTGMAEAGNTNASTTEAMPAPAEPGQTEGLWFTANNESEQNVKGIYLFDNSVDVNAIATVGDEAEDLLGKNLLGGEVLAPGESRPVNYSLDSTIEKWALIVLFEDGSFNYSQDRNTEDFATAGGMVRIYFDANANVTFSEYLTADTVNEREAVEQQAADAADKAAQEQAVKDELQKKKESKKVLKSEELLALQATDEIKSATFEDGKMQILDVMLQTPMKYADLVDAIEDSEYYIEPGYTGTSAAGLEYEMERLTGDLTEIPADETFAMVFGYNYQSGDTEQIAELMTVQLARPTAETTLADCIVTAIRPTTAGNFYPFGTRYSGAEDALKYSDFTKMLDEKNIAYDLPTDNEDFYSVIIKVPVDNKEYEDLGIKFDAGSFREYRFSFRKNDFSSNEEYTSSYSLFDGSVSLIK